MSIVDNPERLPKAPVIRTVAATRGGHIAAIDAAALGSVVIALGGGRARKEDAIDPAVGRRVEAHVGSHVTAGGPLATVHARSETEAEAAIARVQLAYRFSAEPIPEPPLLLDVLSVEPN